MVLFKIRKIYIGIVHFLFIFSWNISFLSCISRFLPLPHFFEQLKSCAIDYSFSRALLASTMWDSLWYCTFQKDSLQLKSQSIKLDFVCAVKLREKSEVQSAHNLATWTLTLDMLRKKAQKVFNFREKSTSKHACFFFLCNVLLLF